MSEFADEFAKFEEARAIAGAIAEREGDMMYSMLAIASEVTGGPMLFSPEMKQEFNVGHTALMVLAVENPDYQLSNAEALRTFLSPSEIERFNQAAAEEGVPLSMERLSDGLIDGLVEIAADISPAEPLHTASFTDKLHAAREVAKTYEVDVPMVYRVNGLYHEMMHKALPPAEAVRLTEAVLEKTQNGQIREMLGKLLGAMMPGMDPENMIQQIEENPIFGPMVRAQMESADEVYRQQFLYKYVTEYGYDAVSELTDSQRDALLPRRRLSEVVAKVIREDGVEL